MKLRPMNDRLLVKRPNADEKTAGGIHIPDNAKERPLRAEVLAVGPGPMVDGHRRPLDVKPGDVILFGKYSGTEIKDGTDDLLMLREEDVLAVVVS